MYYYARIIIPRIIYHLYYIYSINADESHPKVYILRFVKLTIELKGCRHNKSKCKFKENCQVYGRLGWGVVKKSKKSQVSVGKSSKLGGNQKSPKFQRVSET